MVAGVTIRFVGGDITDAAQEAIIGNQRTLVLNPICYGTRYIQSGARDLKSRRGSTTVAGATSARQVGSDVVTIHVAPPDVQAVIADVRSFQRRIFQKLV